MTDQPTPVQKLHIAFDLFEAGVEIMRQNLRRQHPLESRAQIATRLQEWLLTRPGAEHGDGPGQLRKPEEPAA